MGLNFAPTPQWNNAIEKKELANAYQHIRRVEWKDRFGENNLKESNQFSNKLAIPNYSRPDKALISEEVKTYVGLCMNRWRDLEP